MSSGMPFMNSISLTVPSGPPSPEAPLSEPGDQDDQGVVELAALLQVVEDPPDLVVGVAEEPRVDLGHAGEEPLLVVAQRLPRADGVQLRPGLAVLSGPVGVRVDRGQLGVLGEDPERLLPLEHLLPVDLVPHVELPR